MLFEFILLTVLVVCIITDLRERKIYNLVVFPALILTLFSHLFLNGWTGFLYSISGFFVGLLLLFIPYVMGGMGAGDVKLLALIGALKGTVFVLTTAVYMAVIGAVIALCILIFRKGVWNRLKSIMYTLCGFRYGVNIPLSFTRENMNTTYPYGVAIAGGAFVSMAFKNGVLL
jgi:prepilin peptidase CpaA